MTDLPIVILKIAAMFLVMAIGWFARARGYLTESVGQTLSRLLVDLIFPALVFTQMLKTINPEVMREGWYLPLIGFALMVIAEMVAFGVIPFFSGAEKTATTERGPPISRSAGIFRQWRDALRRVRISSEISYERRRSRNTAIFLAAMPNWIYLPLPIVQGLFGAAGIRDILLYNAGFQVALWSVGIWTLHTEKPTLKSFRGLLLNPGLLATVAGILLALAWPSVRTLGDIRPDGIFTAALPLAAGFQALEMVGSLTIPLSLLITGIQLGGLRLSDHIPSRSLAGVIAARLIIAPAATVLIILVAAQAGFELGEVPRITAYLIAAMPVAISCSIVAERFAGDTALAAKAIFYSTLLSIVTVPAFYFVVRYFNL